MTVFGAAALVLGVSSTATAAPSPRTNAEEAAVVFYDAVTAVLAEILWFDGTRADSAVCVPSMVVLGGWHCVATLTGRYVVTEEVGVDGAHPESFEVYGLCGALIGHEGDPCESSSMTTTAPPAMLENSFGVGHYVEEQMPAPGGYVIEIEPEREERCYIATYTDRTADDILENLNLGPDDGGRYYFGIDPEAIALDVEGCPTWTLAEEGGAAGFVSTTDTDDPCIRIELPEMPEDENLELRELPFYGQVWIPDNVREGRFECGGRVILPCRDTLTSDRWAHLVSGQAFVVSGDFPDFDAIGGSPTDQWTLLYSFEHDRDVLGNVGQKWDLSVAVAEEIGCAHWPGEMPLTDITVDCIAV